MWRRCCPRKLANGPGSSRIPLYGPVAVRETAAMANRPAPPRPPYGTPISLNLKGTHLVVDTGGFMSWKTPVEGASIHTIDNTGQRVSLTRVATLGILSLGFKKKTGDLTVIVVGSHGGSATVKAKPKHAQALVAWGVAFNAWSEKNS